MVQPVERNTAKPVEKTAKTEPPKSEVTTKSNHLQLVDETNDPNIRVGLRFQAARKQKDLTTSAISKQIKIRSEYLDAIETMQVARLPKGFVNPYIREYARFLELDANQCVLDFNSQCGALSQGCDAELNVSKRTPDDNVRMMKLAVSLVVCALLAVGGFFGYQMVMSSTDQGPNSASPSIALTPTTNQQSVTSVSGSSAVLSQAVKISIQATERAWIEIRGADGTLFVDRHFSAGESYDLRLGAGWTITTQNAGAFELLNSGETLSPLGEPGQALYTMSVDNAYVATTADTPPLN